MPVIFGKDCFGFWIKGGGATGENMFFGRKPSFAFVSSDRNFLLWQLSFRPTQKDVAVILAAHCLHFRTERGEASNGEGVFRWK